MSERGVVAPGPPSALLAQIGLLMGKRKSRAVKITLGALAGAYIAYRAAKEVQKRPRSLSGRTDVGRLAKKPQTLPNNRGGRAAGQRRALARLVPLLLRVAGRKVVTLLALLTLRTVLSNRLARLQGYLFRAAFLRRVPLFARNLAENLILCGAAAGLEATASSVRARMELAWRRLLTARLHAKYFSGMVYYRLSHVDRRVPAVEQRICEDVPALTSGLAELTGDVLSASVDAAFYAWALRRYSGTHGYTAALLAYVVGVGGLMTVAAPNFAGLHKRQAALEGAYRAVQARLRAGIESVAFYAGMSKEAEAVRGALKDALRAKRRLLHRSWRHGMVQDLLLKYLGATVALALILGPFFGGNLRPDGTITGRAAMLSAMRYHTSVTISLFGALGTLGGAGRRVARLRAHAERLAELEAVMDDIARSVDEASAGDESSGGGEDDGVITDAVTVADGETAAAVPTPGRMLTSKDGISFESVVVMTPANATLVRDLTLHVPPGTNLLVTGPNGAGKSSLFRVLGGLWPLAAGTIRKPGGADDAVGGLSHDVFYVPQRPYVSVGTLAEQLLYPLSPCDVPGAALPPEKMAELLAAVDLGHLLPRADETLDWGGVLSLGEQQRLGMARLFFHKPRFAILDECTSGVSVEMERRFCEMVKQAGCTCITISHRPALMAFHDLVLALDGEGGWSVHQGHRAQHERREAAGIEGVAGGMAAVDPATAQPVLRQGKVCDLETAEAVKTKLRAAEASAVLRGMTAGVSAEPAATGSTDLSDDDSEKAAKCEVVARIPSEAGHGGKDVAAPAYPPLSAALTPEPLSGAARWRMLGRVLFGGSPRRSAAGIGAAAGVVLLRTLLQDRIADLNGRAVDAVLRQDMRGFTWLLAVSAAQGCASAVLAPSLRHIADLLALSWRARLSAAAHELYLSRGAAGYTAVQLAGLEDLDARLTRDIDALASDLASLIPSLAKPAVDIAWFSARLWAMTGRRGTVLCYLYAGAGYAALRALTPDFGAMQARERALDAAFRGGHARLRAHAESVAFFAGGAREGEALSARFTAVAAHARQLIAARWGYSAADEFFARQLPHNVTWVLTLLYSLERGGDLAGDAAQGHLVHQLRYLASVVTSSFSAFGDVLALPRRFAEISGGVGRVTELLQVLETSARFDARSHAQQEEQVLRQGMPSATDSASIEFQAADVVTPQGKLLARELSFRVTPTHPLLVTGPNGVGKTSLFRVLAGLWPLAAGGVHRPGAPAAGMDTGDIYYVPQKPYATIGTLRDQVIYPLTARQALQRYAISDGIDDAASQLDAELDALMEVVRLQYLVEREGGWDAQREWDETLSLGEQQRLGMARLFFHRPKFGILDECTNAVSVDVEEALYEHATLLGITLVTISQRTALVKFHEHELRLLDGRGGWELRKLRP